MILGRIGAVWGLAGVLAILIVAIVRLGGIAIEAFAYPFDWWHWVLLVANTLFMAHSEGYKGFQVNYSPRVVARAMSLARHPHPLRVALAPLFCMGYFHASRRRLLTTYALTIGIIVLIIVFHQLNQPLRGILDAGVVVGLSWGTASIVALVIHVVRGRPFDYSADLPDPV